MSNPLFQRLPELQSIIPWIPIGQFPSRIDTLHITDFNGCDRKILVKREDLCAETYAGNKVRKLEFLLAEAKRQKATRLITVGAAGSHHALATTVHGRAHGFNVTLVLFPQPLTPHVRDILLMDNALGAEIRWTARMELVPLAIHFARIAAKPERSFLVAPGGSDSLGTLGWVAGGLELAAQLQQPGLQRPARIHVAAGTLGTAAGLALGLAMAETPIPIAATRITSRIVTNERLLANLIRGAARILARAGYRAPVEEALRLVEIRHGQIGRGYGRETPEGERALAAFGAAGLRLDATYTAKSAAEVLMSQEDPVLFVHTLSRPEPMDCVQDGEGNLPRAVATYLAQYERG
jgi:D-cysteine desulfhydrase